MTTFHNCAQIIEISGAERVVKLILENRNTCLQWFIHSWIKNLKNIQCKKE